MTEERNKVKKTILHQFITLYFAKKNVNTVFICGIKHKYMIKKYPLSFFWKKQLNLIKLIF